MPGDGGEEQELSLSKPNDVDVKPGNHHVEMYVPWLLPAKMGPAEIVLLSAVRAGQNC